MTSEQFANLAQSTLNASISPGATSLVVVSAANFPTTGNFRIVIDSEIFLVTAVSGTSFTVTPGFEGTAQAAHSSGATVAHVLTAGIISNLYPAQSPATFVVAASNSVNKARANYICSGTNDDVTINAAIAALPGYGTQTCRGGKILLLEGAYSIGSPIVIDGDFVTLEGENIPMWGGYNTSWTNTSSPVGAIGSGCVKIQASTSGFNLVELRNANIPAGNGSNTQDQNRHRGICIRNLYLVGSGYSSTGIASNYGATPLAGGNDFSIIEKNMVQRTNKGINLGMDSVTIRDNSVQDVASDGITLSGTNGLIDGNLIFDIGGIGVTIFTGNCKVTGNTIGDTASYGIYISAGNACVTGNTVANARNAAIRSDSPNCVIGNNVLSMPSSGFLPGIVINNANNNAISGNVITGSDASQVVGAITLGAGINNVVTGNSLVSPWNYGHGNITANSPSANIIGLNTAFVPAAGPAAITTATLQAWYRAADITGITSGSAITIWPDASGFARNLTVATGGPLFESAGTINSGNTVRFNGTNDVLTNANLKLPGQPMTMFMVLNLSATATTKGRNISLVNSNQGASLTNAFVIDSAANKLAGYAGTYTVTSSGGLSVGTSYVLEMLFNGASSIAAVNGSPTSTFNPGANNWTLGLYVGANASANAEWLPGDVAEIAIYDGAMSTGDRSSVRQALGTKYGITVLP